MQQRIGQVLPAIGGQHRGVQVVVDLAQDGHQTLLVDDLVLGTQGLAVTELLQDVVHAGQGQPRVQGLTGLAVGVQLLGQLADTFLFWPVRGRKRKGLEAAGLVVARIVADAQAATGGQGPGDVDSARQDTQHPGVVEPKGYQGTVRGVFRREEHKETVLRRFYGRDVPLESRREGPERRPRVTDDPP
jgi:hypothetical protein